MKLKWISIVLLVLGVIGLLLSTMMFGDIGLAAGIGSLVGILSGLGFWQINKKIDC